MAQCVLHDRAALGTELGLGAGGGFAGDMARGLVPLQPGRAAADAGVFRYALAGAGGVGDLLALVPAMAQRGSVVRNERTAAALADVQGASAALAGGRGGLGNIVVRQRRGDVLDVALPTDSALPQGVAGAGTGGRDNAGAVFVRGLGQHSLFHIAAPLADIQRLARRFTGGIPYHYALIGMAQRVLVVGLDHLAAPGTHHAVIAQRQTGWDNGIMADKVVVVAAALIFTASAVTVRVLAVAVRVSAAAGAGTVRRGGQVDVGHVVLYHIRVVIGVGDFIVDGVVSGLGVVGRAGQGTGVRAVAVADGGGHARLGEIGNSDRVRRAIRHAVIIRYHGLCGSVFGFGIAAVRAGVHLDKPLVRQLRADAAFHAVTLQRGRFLFESSIAKAAVFAAGGDDTVVFTVCLLNGFRFGQFLKEIVGAVVQPVHIFLIAIVCLCHIGVDAAAGFANSFGPVVGCIIGILAGYAV